MTTALWFGALAVALLWPAHALGAFDGAPLNGIAEAVIVGVVVPALVWFHGAFLRRTWARAAIIGLILVRAATIFLPQQGFCARMATSVPLSGEVLTIPIVEPRGFLRSWDVRADVWSETPQCTAILDRALLTGDDFPAWFVNILDFVQPGRRTLNLTIDGYVDAASHGELVLETGADMNVSGLIDDEEVHATNGAPIRATLAPGSHHLRLQSTLAGERWRFVPLFNGRDVFAWPTITSTAASSRWRTRVASMLSLLATALVLAIVLSWLGLAVRRTRLPAPAAAWVTISTLAVCGLAARPGVERFAGPLLLGACLVPMPPRLRTVRGVFALLGVPWLAFFVTRGLAQIGRFSVYSADDWLAYQVAGYRIVMGGYWLEGGSRAFDYQPLYRWISGVLHLVFGDSSVGELYFDAACLLAGGLLAFELAKMATGFRAGVVAGATTLATFTIGTIWYFVGRGLSEIAAAGFAFLAGSFLLRARLGRTTSSVTGGTLAVAMFYTRLNHLVFAIGLLPLALRVRTASSWSAVARALRHVRLQTVAAYTAIFGGGVVLFAARTWWYTGVFSLFYGTALKNNDTGLRLTTLGVPAVRRAVSHSLSTLIWMNEPPRPDVRAAWVAVGVVLAVGALLQMPRLKQLPVPIALVCVAAGVSALFVHTHNYPGRMSVHLVPFAAALAACGSAAVARGLRSGSSPA
jgi:hypothetical protein